MSEKPAYAVQKVIKRAVQAAKDLGMEVGGFEVLPNGTVRVLTKDSLQHDAFADWKRERANAG